MNGICWECRARGPIEAHHPIPQVSGGTRVIYICESCHGKAHGTDRVGHAAMVAQGIAQRRARGLHHGAAPYGWAYAEHGGLEENPEEQAVLHLAVELYDRNKGQPGGWPVVADALNEGGFLTPKGVAWTGDYIRLRVVRDRATRKRVFG